MEKSKDNETARDFLVLLGIPVFVALVFLALVPIGLFNAWAVQKMYIWFILPLGAPALNLWHVWGISLIINHFTMDSYKDNASTTKKTFTKLAVSLIATALMLLLGWIIRGHI